MPFSSSEEYGHRRPARHRCGRPLTSAWSWWLADPEGESRGPRPGYAAFDKLPLGVALGERDEDTLTTLVACRDQALLGVGVSRAESAGRHQQEPR
jgi:hypothetical protein